MGQIPRIQNSTQLTISLIGLYVMIWRLGALRNFEESTIIKSRGTSKRDDLTQEAITRLTPGYFKMLLDKRHAPGADFSHIDDNYQGLPRQFLVGM